MKKNLIKLILISSSILLLSGCSFSNKNDTNNNSNENNSVETDTNVFKVTKESYIYKEADENSEIIGVISIDSEVNQTNSTNEDSEYIFISYIDANNEKKEGYILISNVEKKDVVESTNNNDNTNQDTNTSTNKDTNQDTNTSVNKDTNTSNDKNQDSNQNTNNSNTSKNNNIDVDSISLNYSDYSLYNGSSMKLIATISPDNATNKSVKWTTSNANVASVDESGNVYATGVGSAIITATSNNGKTSKCNINVKEKSSFEVFAYTKLPMTSVGVSGYTYTYAAQEFDISDNNIYFSKNDAGECSNSLSLCDSRITNVTIYKFNKNDGLYYDVSTSEK